MPVLQLLMHGECRDVPLNRAPADMWSEVTGAKPGDGCMLPERYFDDAFSVSTAVYPQHLRMSRAAGAALDRFFIIGTAAASITDQSLVLKLVTATGTVVFASASPTEWTASGLCKLLGNEVQNAWTGGRFNTWEVFNAPGLYYPGTANGLYPCAYDTMTSPAPANAVMLTGWPAGAPDYLMTYAIRPYRDFLVALQKWQVVGGNQIKYQSTIFWSDSAGTGLPTTWTPAAGNQAGDADLYDTPGPLIDAHVLGDDLIVFKPGSCVRMTYVGGAEVMRFSVLNASAGVINRNCIVQHGSRLLVFGRNDIYALSTDGSTESLLTDGVRRYIYGKIAEHENFDGCSLHLSGFEQRLYAFYGQNSSDAADEQYTSQCSVLDLRTGRWGQLTLSTDAYGGYVTAETVGRDSSGDLDTVPGRADYVWLIGNGAANISDSVQVLGGRDFGAANNQVSTLLRKAIDMGEPQRSKIVTGIRLLVDAAVGEYFTVTLTGQQLLDGASTETSGTLTWLAGTTQQLDCLVSGKFFDLTVSNEAIDLPEWKLYGVELEYELRGQW